MTILAALNPRLALPTSSRLIGGQNVSRLLKGRAPAKAKWDFQKAGMALARAVMAGRQTTPKEPLSVNVRKMLRELRTDEAPIFLKLTETKEPLHIAGQCHANVRHHMAVHGGDTLHGWMIWENPIYVEAEFHTVWRAPDGELHDITPRFDKEDTILFLPAPQVRMKKGKNGDIRFNTRTTLKHCPYVLSGLPTPDAFTDVAYSAEGVEELARYGLTSLADSEVTREG